MTADVRLQQDATENSEVAEKQHSKQTFGVGLLNFKIRSDYSFISCEVWVHAGALSYH